MHEPPQVRGLFGADFIGDCHPLPVYHGEGAGNFVGVVLVGLAKVDDGFSAVGGRVEAGDLGYGLDVLVGTVAGVEDQRVVSFSADAVVEPARVVVAVAHVGFMIGSRVYGPAFAQRFQYESAQVDVAVSAQVHAVAGLDAQDKGIGVIPSASHGRGFGAAKMLVEREVEFIEIASAGVVPD